jgi:hypothetical protein
MSATKSAAAPTKAGVAREFMKKIGALTKNPPEGWLKKVEDHLKEKGFTLAKSSDVQIYTIRSKAMGKTKKAAKKSAVPSKGKGKTKSKPKAQHGTIHTFSVDDLASAKKYADGAGGVTRSIETLKALQRLMS